AAGQLPKLTVFGGDYPTRDGTCLRDYLHVVDLAKGHLSALEFAKAHKGAEAFNLGTGEGVSVLELVHTFEKVNGVPVAHVIGARRDGDLAEVYANPTKARRELHWTAEKSVEDMCRDAWHFIQTRSAEA
ncbi:MAG: GDP-mannose 4,6-dehydratase, partial [Oscillospiraceae bacterium]|nr:GDP-mannose 4,6-dehydratase [Oscillospiraceae bacterium]